jgi:hypothetical protein
VQSENFTLLFENHPEIKNGVQFKLRDLSGRILAQRTFEGRDGLNQHRFELSYRPAPGIYIVSVQINGMVKTKRLVVVSGS